MNLLSSLNLVQFSLPHRGTLQCTVSSERVAEALLLCCLRAFRRLHTMGALTSSPSGGVHAPRQFASNVIQQAPHSQVGLFGSCWFDILPTAFKITCGGL